MQLVPTIDLRAGCCVRLSQGERGTEERCGDDPVEMAAHWEGQGAKRLHVVDLDAAFGEARQIDVVASIAEFAEMTGARIVASGGVGTIEHLELLKPLEELGVDEVILGRALYENAFTVARGLESIGGSIVLATARGTLIIDADDTLWENNIHFEEATERFLDLAESHAGSRENARELLESHERRNIPGHGYGTRGFTRSMMDALEEITKKPTSASDRERILALGHRVRNMPIQYLPGVRETLPLLKRHYRLILFTKGDHQEQNDKVQRSGATLYFHHVEVTGEKSSADYEELVKRHGIELESGWMVGNSPRSDVNPALNVGLGAVYIPHPRTWSLENEDVQPRKGARLKVLKRFSDLLEHFLHRQ